MVPTTESVTEHWLAGWMEWYSVREMGFVMELQLAIVMVLEMELRLGILWAATERPSDCDSEKQWVLWSEPALGSLLAGSCIT